MEQSRTERQGYLSKIIGTAQGRSYVMTEYKRAVGMPTQDLPQAAMPFSAMIEKILDREFPA
jgi:hypothetical protein